MCGASLIHRYHSNVVFVKCNCHGTCFNRLHMKIFLLYLEKLDPWTLKKANKQNNEDQTWHHFCTTFAAILYRLCMACNEEMAMILELSEPGHAKKPC